MTRVLFVCTANLARSPMGQAFASSAVPIPGAGHPLPDEGLQVRSAGVAAVAGMAVHPGAAAVLARRGLDLPGFASRQLEPADLSWAELVLTATRAHRSACVQQLPAAVRRCFTLKELSRLALVMEGQALVADASAAAVLRAVPVARSHLQPVPAEQDDLADPVLHGPEAFDRCADEIAELLAPVLRLLAYLFTPESGSAKACSAGFSRT